MRTRNRSRMQEKEVKSNNLNKKQSIHIYQINKIESTKDFSKIDENTLKNKGIIKYKNHINDQKNSISQLKYLIEALNNYKYVYMNRKYQQKMKIIWMTKVN